MFGLGTTELMVVLFIALLLFGKRLPEVMHSLGASFKAFRRGLQSAEDDLRESLPE